MSVCVCVKPGVWGNLYALSSDVAGHCIHTARSPGKPGPITPRQQKSRHTCAHTDTNSQYFLSLSVYLSLPISLIFSSLRWYKKYKIYCHNQSIKYADYFNMKYIKYDLKDTESILHVCLGVNVESFCGAYFSISTSEIPITFELASHLEKQNSTPALLFCRRLKARRKGGGRIY